MTKFGRMCSQRLRVRFLLFGAEANGDSGSAISESDSPQLSPSSEVLGLFSIGLGVYDECWLVLRQQS